MSLFQYIGLVVAAVLLIVAYRLDKEPTDIDDRLSAADDEIRNRQRVG